MSGAAGEPVAGNGTDLAATDTSASGVVGAAVQVGAGDDVIRGIARGGSANLVGAIGTAVSQLALTVIVARALSLADTGVFFTVTSLFLIAVAVGNLGANTGLVYFLARLRAGSESAPTSAFVKAAFVPTTVLSLVMSVGVYLLAEPLARSIAPGSLELAADSLRAVAIFLPFASWESLAVAASRGTGSMRPNVVVSLIGRPLVQLAFVGLVLWVGSGGVISWGWGAAYVPAAVLALVWMRSLLRRRQARTAALAGSDEPLGGSGGSPAVAPLADHDDATRVAEGPDVPDAERPGARHRTPHTSVLGRFWRFSSARAVTSVMQVLAQRLDIVLVASLSSARDAAIYTAATRFVVVGQMAANALMMATQPRLAVAIARGDRAEVSQIYRTSTSWLVALTWPVYLVLIVFGETLLQVFGRSYGVGGVVIALISVAMLLSMAFGMLDTVLTMSGRTFWNLANAAVGLAVQIGVDVLLIPHLGFTGAAIGWSASIIVRNVVGLVMVSRAVHVTPFSRATLACMGLAVFCYLVISQTSEWVLGSGWVAFAVATVVGTGLYVVGLLRLRESLHLGALADALLRRRRSPRTPA